MPARKLKEFLDIQGVSYESITHRQTFTAQRTAQSVHVKGRDMAKTIIVKVDGRACMAVLPAHHHIDLARFKAATGGGVAELASEQEFESLFPGCEIGAMPPFGNLFDMEVFVQEDLAKDEQIAFNAGTHTEVFKLAYKDFEDLVKPKHADFSRAG